MDKVLKKGGKNEEKEESIKWTQNNALKETQMETGRENKTTKEIENKQGARKYEGDVKQ